ncbi:uncharacterized protein LOC125853550 [Solanum stenotomum]|uniref:uncharacterized protein LOC125853550 n=1 Tax=Solanum stenotomum TaxID=172797 RepID=UPI0020D1EEE5|nr:uncharacterized protein LOC125853550 [Solanum stenotomum]
MGHIIAIFHHGGRIYKGQYVSKLGNIVFSIDKDHFSLTELKSYAKDIGYDEVDAFFTEDPITHNFVKIESDNQLYNFVKDLWSGSFFKLFLKHVTVKKGGSTATPSLGPFSVENNNQELGNCSRVSHTEHGINGEGEVEQPLNEENDDSLNFEEDNLDDVPDQDDSEVDEELRAFREKLREDKQNEAAKQKKRTKKLSKDQGVELGEVGIDKGFENIFTNKAAKFNGKLGGDEVFIDSSDEPSKDSDEELDVLAQPGVDLPSRRKSNKLRYDSSSSVSFFELGMIFESATQFRKAVADYAVQHKVQLRLKPNESHRVRVKCEGKCKWEIFASLDKDSGNFFVKKYYPAHRCISKNKNRLCTAKYVEMKMRDRIISQPDMRVHKLQETLKKEWGLKVGRSICFRAKMNVIAKFLGDWKLEFSRLLDYADMIKSTNPGSSCWVRTDNETVNGLHLFKYFYVCFAALKNGWLEGCRKIIGLDGCFLKGACRGVLLVAVGKNGNNQMYPIAWAVVDQETKHSWSWFLNYLIEDLQLGDGSGITVMSDMQKGLEVAVEVLLPNAERRMCARHIWANWQKRWRGEERRKAFWRCAKASFEVKLRDEFEYLGKLGDRICEALLGYNKEYWCRALFSERSKCDVVENNMCETFNSWIVGPRHKSVISMLEDIRHKMMDRHGDMIKFVDTWIGDISPMARLILEENKEIGRTLRVNWNHDIGFEIQEGEYRHIIDMTRKTCSCRLWQLRGIPCQHAVCALYHIGQEPEDYVEHWYKKDTFLRAYKYFLQPISNMIMWPDTNNPPVEPPEVKPMPGRPGRCRRKDKDEPRKKKWGKASKNGVKMSCSKCHQVGHNKRTCKSVPSQQPTQQPARPFQQPPVRQPSQPPLRQPSTRNASSLCADTSKVKGRKKKEPIASATSSSVGMPPPSSVGMPPAPSVGRKRTRDVGFGVYTDIQTGRQVINQGRSSERVISSGTGIAFKDASQTNVDLGFKPPGLKWKGKDAMTRNQLQQLSKKKVQSKSKGKWVP